MIVLSLFDGISSGQLALEKAGIHVNKYYASEIDKYAINVTQFNYPKTIQLGDVLSVNNNSLPKIDLLIRGSPCVGFSSSGKRLNFNDPKSKLFFEFVRLLNECKPTNWLLENVVMKKEYENIISKYLNVQPVKINSALVSAQNQERLYWANFPITQPIDKGIKLVNILEDTEIKGLKKVISKYDLNKGTIVDRRLNDKDKREDTNLTIPLIQHLEVRNVNNDKSNCLTTVDKDNILTTLPTSRYPNVFKNNLPFRYYTIKEYCRLQTVPEYYFNNIKSENQEDVR